MCCQIFSSFSIKLHSPIAIELLEVYQGSKSYPHRMQIRFQHAERVCQPLTQGVDMSIPLNITSRDFPLTEAIETLIRQKTDKLEKMSDRITECNIVIESPHNKQRKGKTYMVRIDVKIPKSDLVVKRQPHNDIYVAIRDAFQTAQRLVEEQSRKMRNEVKVHEEPPQGEVKEIYPVEGFGFLHTPEGSDIYFHRNSVVDDGFEKLDIGTKVRYVSVPGEKGPQASTVAIVS